MFSWLKRQKPKQALKTVLKDQSLPSFPALIMKTLQQVRDPDVPLTVVGNTVQNDPGLSVQILRTANSAAYSLKHPVQNIAHAVSLLGRSQVESLLLAAGVNKVVGATKTRGFDQGLFWRGAGRRAATARALADVLHPATQAESFSAALLQDMAVPVLANARGDEYGAVLQDWRTSMGHLEELERQRFDWDHAEVASWMCVEWEFPEPLSRAIADHHGGAEIPAAVALSARLHDLEGVAGKERLIEDLYSDHNIPRDRATQVVEAAQAEGETLAQAFG